MPDRPAKVAGSGAVPRRVISTEPRVMVERVLVRAHALGGADGDRDGVNGRAMHLGAHI